MIDTMYYTVLYSWTPHFNNMVDAARRSASWVLSLFSDRSPETMMTSYKSLIRSRLEYCCPPIMESPHHQKQIESVQSCRHLDYHEPLKHLGLFSLQRRRERYIIIHMWKVLHDLSPNDFDIEPLVKVAGLASKQSFQHYQDNVRPQLKAFMTLSFAVMGPRLWNAIPANANVIRQWRVLKMN